MIFVFCFYLDFLNFSSIDFCLEAEWENKTERGCSGNELSRGKNG